MMSNKDEIGLSDEKREKIESLLNNLRVLSIHVVECVALWRD